MTEVDEVEFAPVKVSGEAQKVLSQMVRQWTGWRNARLVLGETRPEVSPFAMTEFDTRTVTADPDVLVLNPNRVLNTVTPFRLRQEAVLTGTLIHEAGHARHTLWLPRTPEDHEKWKHDDGKGDAPTPQEVSLARCLEEPRIEGLMARDARANGTFGLVWTMRAASAKLLPMTDVSEDPAQAVLDVIQSWVLRAGRQLALAHWTSHNLPNWVYDFTNFLNAVLVEHFEDQDNPDPHKQSSIVIDHLHWMFGSDADSSTYLIDTARDVLRMLFPETDDEDMPQMGGSCSGGGGHDEGEPQSGDQEGDGTEAQAGAAEPGDGDSEGQGTVSGLAEDTVQALANIEAKVMTETQGEVKVEASKSPLETAGGSGNGVHAGGWRDPSKSEREMAKKAETFLRSLVDPSEQAKVTLSDSPTSNIDGAALSAWKAGGMHGDPLFFRRTNRAVEPAPPVKIAVLVDVSSSMEELQKPSALLSWALAVSAFDMRNFAGRGRQIESCLIHWGDSAEVIQRNGEQLPGIREVSCNQGTRAMDEALTLVEQQIPGFFDPMVTPENRLLVQFTDWELFGLKMNETTTMVREALRVGVNMLTVAPQGWGRRGVHIFEDITSGMHEQRGRSHVLRYDPRQPDQVWSTASTLLKG